MGKMVHKELEYLIENALKTSSKEFLKVVEDVQLLFKESGCLGSLKIKGKLVIVPPKGKAVVVGDVHGDLESLVYVLRDSCFIEKVCEGENIFLIFLGDYGDRGTYSPEVYYVILRLKEWFPENVILLRGNHEGPRDILAHPHDLPTHLQRKFGEEWSNIYTKLLKIFDHLYNAVLVDERYIILHGGIPSKASTMDDLAYAHKKHPQESHLEEILWSDPKEDMNGIYYSPRGAGRLFGEDVTDKFLTMFNAKALIRGHEPSREGFKINHNGKILTLFSRRGPPYHNRHGAYLLLNLSEKIKSVKQLEQYIHKF
ncbi:metallophosphoesterase [Candidatus Bathyarchaeota archaeon]|nr:metallophosphoesterase [Candidatus Bathyarchaeota archaeon]